MKHHPNQALEAIQHALHKSLGGRLTALYLFGSLAEEKYTPGLSYINLLAVIEEPGAIHQIRDALQPVWHEYDRTIRRLPLIATPVALNRHLQLNPLLADHLTQYGRLLTGRPQNIPTQPITIVEHLSHLAQTALTVSEAIAPNLLPDQDKNTAEENLRRLAIQLEIDHNQSGSAIQTFAAIQAHLAATLDQHPSLKWQGPTPTGAPPMVTSLLAIYEIQDRAVFLLPDWTPDKIEAYINEVEWTNVSRTLEGQYNGLQITTPSLLRLIYQNVRSAEQFIQSHQHAWGQNPLATLQPAPAQIYRDLACHPSYNEIETFPHAYITAGNNRLDMLIHDFQNKVLNIQLREELVSRLERRPRTGPPNSLPGRDTPAWQRIDAIFQRFNWWANHYATNVRQFAKLPPTKQN